MTSLILNPAEWTKKLSQSSVITRTSSDGALEIVSSDYASSSVSHQEMPSFGVLSVEFKNMHGFPQVHLGREDEGQACVVIYLNSSSGRLIAANLDGGSLSEVASDTFDQYDVNASYTWNITWDQPYLLVEVRNAAGVVAADFVTRSATAGVPGASMALGANGTATISRVRALSYGVQSLLQVWGDSQTVSRDGVEEELSVASLLKQSIGSAGLVFGRGVEGARSHQVLSEVLTHCQSLGSAPSKSVVLVGGNDYLDGASPQTTWSHIQSLLQELENRDQEVAICTYPLRRTGSHDADGANAYLRELNALIRGGQSAKVLDLERACSGKDGETRAECLQSDGRHLSPHGHGLLSSLIMSWEAL